MPGRTDGWEHQATQYLSDTELSIISVHNHVPVHHSTKVLHRVHYTQIKWRGGVWPVKGIITEAAIQ